MYDAACCDDMLTWSMSGRSYEPCYPVAPTSFAACSSGAAGLQCSSADPATRLQYGTCNRTMTNRALNPTHACSRPSPHPADCMGVWRVHSLFNILIMPAGPQNVYQTYVKLSINHIRSSLSLPMLLKNMNFYVRSTALQKDIFGHIYGTRS